MVDPSPQSLVQQFQGSGSSFSSSRYVDGNMTVIVGYTCKNLG